MIAQNLSFHETCSDLFVAFFKQYPNNYLQKQASMAVLSLLKRRKVVIGKPEGWVAGIVFAVGGVGCGVLNVLNMDLEKAFGVSMSTTYKQSMEVKRLLGLAE